MKNSTDNGLSYSKNGKTFISPFKMLIAPNASVIGTIDLDSINAREEEVKLAQKMSKLKKKFNKGKGKGA